MMFEGAFTEMRSYYFNAKIVYWLIWFVSLPISIHFNFHAKENFCNPVENWLATLCDEHCSKTCADARSDRYFDRDWKKECEGKRCKNDRSQWKAILSCLVWVINNPIVNYNRQQWQSAKLFSWTYECLLLLIVSFNLQ